MKRKNKRNTQESELEEIKKYIEEKTKEYMDSRYREIKEIFKIEKKLKSEEGKRLGASYAEMLNAYMG